MVKEQDRLETAIPVRRSIDITVDVAKKINILVPVKLVV